MRKRNLAISLAAVAVAAAAGGGAYAASQGGSSTTPGQALIADIAQRLHVTPTQLTDAIKAAQIDQINAEVKAGRLTQAQANQLEQRIQQGPGLPFGPFFARPRAFGPFGFGYGAPGFLEGAAAKYLGLGLNQLRQQLASGKSLAQMASAQHKSVTGLEQAITAAAKSRLDQAVAAGRLTKAQEQQQLSRLSQELSSIVNRTLRAGPPQGGLGPRGFGPQGGLGPRGFGPRGGYRGYGPAGPIGGPPPPGA